MQVSEMVHSQKTYLTSFIYYKIMVITKCRFVREKTRSLAKAGKIVQSISLKKGFTRTNHQIRDIYWQNDSLHLLDKGFV